MSMINTIMLILIEPFKKNGVYLRILTNAKCWNANANAKSR